MADTINIHTIATHNGSFHLDEIVAIAIMKILDNSIAFVRTRAPEEFNRCDMRIDVGGEYDPETNTYDHHQQEGAGLRGNGVPYASAGLIWKHFGRELCVSDEVHKSIDEIFIQPVDDADNGNKAPNGGTYSLFRAFRILDRAIVLGKESSDEGFGRALDIVKYFLENELFVANAQSEINAQIRALLPEFEGKPYLVLENDTSWQQVVVNETVKLYVIYPSSDGRYRVRCVPTKIDGFASRKPLPEEWRGLTDDALVKVSGIEGGLFCHKNGFIASATTIESAIALGEKAYSP